MKTLSYDINRSKIEKEFAWLATLILGIAGFPLLKKAIIFMLAKLYELFIQHAGGK